MRLVLVQLAYENRVFWRNAIAAFFTVAMPLTLMVLFCLLFGNQEFRFVGGTVKVSTFFVPAISAMAVIGACYTNIAMMVSITRESGLLKRYRGTPLPSWVLLLGKISHAVFVGLLLVVILVLVGVVFFDVTIAWDRVDALILTLVVGSATFCALGLALTTVIPSAQASPAIVQATVLPLLFISDVFIPMQNAPEWLQWFASIFPVRHFALSLQASFNPYISGSGYEWLHLSVMGLWFVFGLVVATIFFRWEPRK